MNQTITLPHHPNLLKKAKKQHLVYSADNTPGISRMKKGKGFTYIDENGQTITNSEVLDRIKKLVIPPAWTDVWINPNEYGHLQATGRDEKGRKQYLYHQEWMKLCQQDKFDKLLRFAEVLPTIREEIQAGLTLNKLDKRKVLATVVWLLENTYIRIGNPEYAKENDHYGLTTLRSKHVTVVNSHEVKLEFTGKSGVFHEVDINHPKVARTIRKLDELPGYELFKYFEDGAKNILTSDDVNEYLRSISGEDITAKDFRTWGGTVSMGNILYKTGPGENKTQIKKNITAAVKEVARYLHNTPATSRKYYIHPRIIDAYQNGVLIPHFENVKTNHIGKPKMFSVYEYATYKLLAEKNGK